MQSFAGLSSLDRHLTSLHHSFVQTRRRKVTPLCGASVSKLHTSWLKPVKPLVYRALPDHFSQSKVSLNTAASNVEVLERSVEPESQQAHEAEVSRDREHRNHVWNEWLEYFSEVESAESELVRLDEQLQEHVTIEHYDDAATTNQQIQELGSLDILTTIHNKLDDAVAEERFDEAAKLRDEGLIGLCGWWVARGHNDPQGKLVYIDRSFCRYSGRLFTMKDITNLCIQPPYMMPAMFGNVKETPEPFGNPALEVFLKADEDTLKHQACVLRTPTLQDIDKGSTVEILPQESEVAFSTETDESGKAVRLTVTIIQKDDEEEPLNPGFMQNTEADAEVSAIVVTAHDEGSSVSEDRGEQTDTFTPFELQYRMPAVIRWWDRNRFVLSVDEDLNPNSDDFSNESEEEKPTKEPYEVLTGSGASAIEKIPFRKIYPFIRGVKYLMDAISKSPNLQDERLKLPTNENMMEMSHEFMTRYSAYLKKEIFGMIQENNDLEGEVMFTRLPLDDNDTDIFTGFFIGSFGPHGPELLHLSRQTDKTTGKDFLQARKITGDQKVPAGEISFQASIDRSNRSVPDLMAGEDLGIRASYKGRGRIGEDGSSDLKWVDGELLVFDGSSAISGGAELGLVWHVPNKRKAYVMLHRIKLPACDESQ